MPAKKPSAPKTYTITAEEKEFLERQLAKDREERASRTEELKKKIREEQFEKRLDWMFAPTGTPEQRAAEKARADLQFDIALIKHYYRIKELLKKFENKETSLRLMEAQLELMPKGYEPAKNAA